MPYLSHSAQAQLGALPLGLLGWTLLAVALGLVEWRMWISSSVASGIAWVGVWRACFHTHSNEVTPGFLILHCSNIDFSAAFTPPEICAAQVLMLVAVGLGLFGNSCALYALRNAFFGIKPRTHLAFLVGGASNLAAAILALIPLVWNLVSVLTNRSITFPPEFKLPESPDEQRVGGAVWAGLVGVALMVVMGMIFVTYKLPKERLTGLKTEGGKDNTAFEFDEVQL